MDLGIPPWCMPFIAVCYAGLGDVFMMSFILRHLKMKCPDSWTILITKPTYRGLFANGQHSIDEVIFEQPHIDKIKLLRQLQEYAGDKVYYYDLFHDRPDLAPWPGAVWKGHAIFDRYKNAMPDPDLSDLHTRNHVPLAIENEEANKKAREKFPKNRKRIVIEYMPVSFYSPLTHIQWEIIMRRLNDAGYECLWIAGKDAPPFSVGVDGRGIPFDISRSIIAQSDGFVGIGSGLTCLACTIPKVNKIELQNNGIYCWKTVCPNSKNHHIIDPRGNNLAERILGKLRE